MEGEKYAAAITAHRFWHLKLFKFKMAPVWYVSFIWKLGKDNRDSAETGE